MGAADRRDDLALSEQPTRPDPSLVQDFTDFCQRRWLVSPDLKDTWRGNEKALLRSHLNRSLERLEGSSRRVMPFIDAVDEAVQGSTDDVVEHLHQLDRHLRQLGISARICISCRHFPILTKV